MNITFNYNDKPQEIRFDGQCYSPIKRLLSKNGKTGAIEETVTPDGYFKNLGGAVKRIVDNELGADESTVTLMEYVARYENAVKEIRNIIEEDEF